MKKEYGRLVLLGPTEHRGSAKIPYVLCACVCGTEKWIHLGNIKRGAVQSCGCLVKEKNTKHGHSTKVRSPTYSSWTNLLQRCGNPKYPTFNCYGGRGIGVDPRWLNFDIFLADMGERPAGTTLDRIDNNGDYCKDNCRWATRATQAQNTRRTKLTPELVREIRASTEPLCAIALRVGAHKATIAAARKGISWKEVL